MRSRRLIPLVATGVVATLAPGPARAAAADPEAIPQKPVWRQCSAPELSSSQCAHIKVPLDYRHPDGKKIDLAISRIRTSTAGKRRGVLLFNPGGPGLAGLSVPQIMKDKLPESVRDQFDLIGFDPRGVGRSSPVTCGLTDEEQEWSNRPYRPASFSRDVALARTVADKCHAKAGDTLPHLTTRNTARDMDVIRSVLGEQKISYFGGSYGTYLGAVYTQMFPGRTDRFVLDSAVDPNRFGRGTIQAWASGAEQAFSRWAQWTAQRHALYGLGDTPAKVKKTFWDLVARADRTPIRLDGKSLTGDDIRARRSMFFTVRDAAEKVVELRKAAAGRKKAAAAGPREEPVGEPSGDNTTVGFWSIVCGDAQDWPRDPAQYRHDALRDKEKYPLYGDFASHIKPCAFWGNGSEPTTIVNNDIDVLILQNQWDSQTPLASAQGMHRALKGSRMVYVVDGEGHGVYGSDPNSCADKAANAYLSTGRLPDKDVACRATDGQKHDSAKRLIPKPRRPLSSPDRS
ncbi:alpha/beta hydrolase [Streptomyces chrestomyceticus]|uniref:alpha/beta hydrolase n=1 Tax=Streptomyces chrestomyceticus TaxID=68185 RepID=UPI003410D536